MKRQDVISAVIGALIGITVVGYVIVYIPMKRNYDECGQLTLCNPSSENHHD